MVVLEKITTAVTVSLDSKDQLNELHRGQYQGMAKTAGSAGVAQAPKLQPTFSSFTGHILLETASAAEWYDSLIDRHVLVWYEKP